MKPKKKISSRQVSVSVIERVYRFLPFFFLAMAALNGYVVISYLQSDKQHETVDRERVYLSVSNLYAYVHSNLTREVEIAKRSFGIDLALYKIPLTNNVSSVSNVFESVAVKSDFRFDGSLECWYSRVAGEDCLVFGDSSFYCVGDDFGYGVIEKISRMSCVCDGRRYRLQYPIRRQSPVRDFSFERKENPSSNLDGYSIPVLSDNKFRRSL